MKETSRIFIILAILALTVSSAGAGGSNKAYWVNSSNSGQLNELVMSAGEEKTLRLNVEVPAEKNLKAYSFVLFYDEKNISIKDVWVTPESDMPPLNINASAPGRVIVNSFSLAGVKGQKVISIMDMAIKAENPGSSEISILISNFGTSADNQFIPETVPLKIIVK